MAMKSALELAMEILDSTIRARVAFNAPDRIFVHAGVVPRLREQARYSVVSMRPGARVLTTADSIPPVPEQVITNVDCDVMKSSLSPRLMRPNSSLNNTRVRARSMRPSAPIATATWRSCTT